jgi:predicted TIM-barrel fold metal-dependent hydrolase
MIVDAHVHAGEYPLHFTENFASQMMAAVGHPREDMKTLAPTLLSEMEAAGVDKVFLLAFDAQRTLNVKVPNEYVAQLCQTYPDRFIGFGSVDAGAPGAAEVVEYCATSLGLRGIKIAPAYVRLSPADRCWYEVYEAAQSLKLPVLAHTGVTPIKQAEQRYFSPMLLDEVATHFPNLRLILAHLGTPWVMPCLDLLAKHSNLYADVSIFGWFQPVELVASILASARSQGVLDRLLWGTDYPMCSLTSYIERMERFTQDTSLFPDGQVLNQEEWTGLMGATALQLFDA